MISTKDLNELEDLHKAGVGVREIIIAAFQCGRAYELAKILEASPLIASIGEQVSAAEKQAKLDRNNEIAMKNFDLNLSYQNGCFREEYD